MADSSSIRPATTSQRSGCLTVLYVVLALGAVTVVCVALGAWLFMRSETGQKVMKTVKEGVNISKEAMNAPGTAALRERGCTQAMVMPIGQLVELLGQFSEAMVEEVRKSGLPGNGTMVFCQLERQTTPALGCSEVARVYAGAAPQAPDIFGVVVQRMGQREPECQGTYSRDGTFVEPIERK